MKLATILFAVPAIFSATVCSAQAENAAPPAATTSAVDAPKYERLLVPVHFIDPAAVAEKITALFNHGNRGQSTVSALSVPGTNCLMVSASQEDLGEVARIVAQLDRTPRAVAIDVWIVDLHPDAAKGVESSSAHAPAELISAGPRAKVIEELAKLEKEGKALVVNHLQLTSLEGHEAMAQQGERKPRITATNVNQGGRMSTVTFENTGTIVKATPRVTGNQVILDINAEKSFMGPEFTGAIISQPINGPEVRSPSAISLVGKATLTLNSGEVGAMTGLKGSPDDAAGSYQVLVSAEVLPEHSQSK
jgi:type II secretory pathway component GspD/PulD (secretin)